MSGRFLAISARAPDRELAGLGEVGRWAGRLVGPVRFTRVRLAFGGQEIWAVRVEADGAVVGHLVDRERPHPDARMLQRLMTATTAAREGQSFTLTAPSVEPQRRPSHVYDFRRSSGRHSDRARRRAPA